MGMTNVGLVVESYLEYVFLREFESLQSCAVLSNDFVFSGVSRVIVFLSIGLGFYTKYIFDDVSISVIFMPAKIGYCLISMMILELSSVRLIMCMFF